MDWLAVGICVIFSIPILFLMSLAMMKPQFSEEMTKEEWGAIALMFLMAVTLTAVYIDQGMGYIMAVFIIAMISIFYSLC